LAFFLINIPDRVGFVASNHSRRINLIKLRTAAIIDTSNHDRHSERARSASLSESLHDASDVLRNIIDARSLIVSQSVALSFDTRIVHNDSGISIEAGEGGADVVVDQGDLLEGSGMLQLLESLFFDS